MLRRALPGPPVTAAIPPLHSLLFTVDNKTAVLYDRHVCLQVKYQPEEEPFER